MKTKIILMHACIIIAIILAGYYTQAQTQIAKPMTTASQLSVREVATDFSYKIFQAPNKMYGYDIFRDGKIIFHQGALPVTNDIITALSKKDQANKAALLSVEKIKKNQPPTLTQEEIKKITIK